MPFSRGSSQPRDQTQVSLTAADSLPSELPRSGANPNPWHPGLNVFSLQV